MSEGKTLHLTLNKKWFDMIASGEKKEEYRDIKPYWIKRFIDTENYPKEFKNDGVTVYEDICYDILENGFTDFESLIKQYHCSLNTFKSISANNGYAKYCPNVKWIHEGISIGEGKTEWGAEKGKLYFILKVGEIFT